MRAIHFLLVLALLPPSLLCAQRQKPVTGMPDGGTTEVLQSIYIPALLNAPFTAVVHTEWSRPIPGGGSYTYVNQRRVARDSHGRIYEERWLLAPKDGQLKSQMNVIQIADPESHTLYNCFIFQRRCLLENFSEPATTSYRPATAMTGPLQDNKGFSTHEDLGIRTIDGVDTRGSRDITTVNPGVYGNDRPLVTTREFWQASQIGINLLSTLDAPGIGHQSFTLTDLTFSEPEPQLFELPEGFEIVDRRQVVDPHHPKAQE